MRCPSNSSLASSLVTVWAPLSINTIKGSNTTSHTSTLQKTPNPKPMDLIYLGHDLSRSVLEPVPAFRRICGSWRHGKLAAPPKNNTRTLLPTIHILHPPQAIDPASYHMPTTMDGVSSLKPLNGFVINNLTCFHVHWNKDDG
jgi:hypothetical protein